MKEVLIFPDYKVHKDTEKVKRCVGERLRDDLGDPQRNVCMEHWIYIALPDDEHHEDKHLLGQLIGFMNHSSKDVRDKLVELVGHGVTSVAEMSRHLRVFVDTHLFLDKTKPASSDAVYYPADETIRKHVYKAQLRRRYSKLDQENLIQQVSEWQQNYPDDNFSFMPASPATTHLGDEDIKVECLEQDDDDEIYPQLVTQTEATEFFFCHQTQFQRHLLCMGIHCVCLMPLTVQQSMHYHFFFWLLKPMWDLVLLVNSLYNMKPSNPL
ncbi:uncharacterized protein LOC117314759 isoform X1 [Pecten maximus]|uniref:uncharacterized protein LOC117314759 isoform X1 n=1 Tax=Pecten maximus TaxID=6579 RepID=UPI001458440D|nr:uncharacterized protein LOC117314759 isoform X1 [Pecten maximus]